MKALRRRLAAVLSFSLVVSSFGPAAAAEFKAPVEAPRAIVPIAPTALPQLNLPVELPVAPLATVETPVLPVPNAAAPSIEAPAAPWRERLAALGQRFTEIIGLKGAGEQNAGFGNFFDLSGLQPAYAGAAMNAVPETPSQPSVLMMSSTREPVGTSNRGTPPAPREIRDRLKDGMAAKHAALRRATTLNAFVSMIAAATAITGGARPISALILALLPVATTVIADSFREKAAARFNDSGFPSLFAAEKAAQRAALISRLGALASMDVGGMLALKVAHVSPAAGLVLGAAVLTGWAVWRLAKGYAQAAYLRRAELYGELKNDEPQAALADIPGASALEKHGRYFAGGKEVAKFKTTYHYVRMQGLSPFGAFTTALSWHLFFSGKTQKNMTAEEKARFKPGRFDNYIPNFADAQGPTNTRIYAMKDIPGVAKKGDVDMREFERLFRDFAPGRDYLTMKDLGRIWKANAERDDAKGVKKIVGKIAFNKRFKQLLTILGDRVVEEDGKLVPAISRAGLLRYYHGGAPYDLLRERGGS